MKPRRSAPRGGNERRPPTEVNPKPSRRIPKPIWGLLFLALGLRLWNLAEGLPDFFEEAFPFRRAFDMTPSDFRRTASGARLREMSTKLKA